MNWVDILLILAIILTRWTGWAQGFIHGILSLLTWAGSIVFGYLFHPYLTNTISKLFNLGVWLLPLAFILMVIIARLILGWLFGFIYRTIPESTNHNRVNKFFGMIPGAINGWIYAIVLSALLLALPFRHGINTATRESRYATQFAMQSEWANRKLAPVFNDAVRQTLNNLTVNPDSKEKVNLSFTHDKRILNLAEINNDLLYLLNAQKQFLVGNGGWSYALNNEQPMGTSVLNFYSKTVFPDTIAFEGRTPCRGLDDERPDCYKRKWLIVFFII